MMRKPIFATSLATFVMITACVSSSPPPQQGPPPQCANGPPMCAPDRGAVIQCQNGQWIMLQACPGARGCGIANNNNMIQCDTSPRVAGPAPAPAPAAAGGVGEACAAEGGYGCTNDRRGLTICRGGRTALASTCRGQRGCAVGNAVDCDHSVAMAGDPCESPKEIACSMDSKALLRCAGTVYQVSEPCRNACLSTGGRVLCQ
jgi:hypothetical protein